MFSKGDRDPGGGQWAMGKGSRTMLQGNSSRMTGSQGPWRRRGGGGAGGVRVYVRPYLKATLDHPPAHQALAGTSRKEETQAASQGPCDPAPGGKEQSRAQEDEPQCPAPHPVRVLHAVDELELGHAEPPVGQTTLTALLLILKAFQ